MKAAFLKWANTWKKNGAETVGVWHSKLVMENKPLSENPNPYSEYISIVVRTNKPSSTHLS